MDTEEKVNKTLEFISRDRILEDDPYFTSRLMARLDNEFSAAGSKTFFLPLYYRLRPLLATFIIMLGIFTGILLGTRLGREPMAAQNTDRSSRLHQFAQEEFITEINGSPEEQLLSNK
jgi:hypothetical protein